MQPKVFFDANVLLDLLLKRDGHEVMRLVLEQAANETIRGYTSVSVLHILAYWLQKAYGNATSRKILLELTEELTLVDCSHSSAVAALESPFSDIEDALQYQVAVQHKINYFITKDKGIIRLAGKNLPALTPKAFLEAEM